MAVIFNAFIIEERFKPIWTMLDEIFKKVMSRVASKKQIADHLQQDICLVILKKLEKAKDICRWWQVSRAGCGMYSVNNESDSFVVDIVAKTCNAWELSGIPCHHALVVMREEKMNPTQFVNKRYRIEMLGRTYAHTLQPINGPNLWPPCEDEPIVAPVFRKKKNSNYQFKRRPEEGERRPHGQYGAVLRSGGTVKCSLCK
uniref:SWIM-type domain-containing protein n=1 Tax=Opuntia streptacantha TaxID=393608 RepID=A0A7C9E3S3_OPUST